MMAIVRTPMESALSLALDPPTRRRRLSASTMAAIGVASLLHAGLAAYLYSMKLNPARPEATPEDRAIVVTTYRPPKPQPLQPSRAAPTPSSQSTAPQLQG